GRAGRDPGVHPATVRGADPVDVGGGDGEQVGSSSLDGGRARPPDGRGTPAIPSHATDRTGPRRHAGGVASLTLTRAARVGRNAPASTAETAASTARTTNPTRS